MLKLDEEGSSGATEGIAVENTPAGSLHGSRLPLFIALVALAIRLAVIPFVIGATLDPDRDHWNFGWEEGRIARSIAAGEGFSSPLFGKTGPTAWTTPVYPGLLAGGVRPVRALPPAFA